MRASLVWRIEDLILPGDTAEIGNSKIGEDGKNKEGDDVGHGDDFTACPQDCCAYLMINFTFFMDLWPTFKHEVK